MVLTRAPLLTYTQGPSPAWRRAVTQPSWIWAGPCLFTQQRVFRSRLKGSTEVKLKHALHTGQLSVVRDEFETDGVEAF